MTKIDEIRGTHILETWVRSDVSLIKRIRDGLMVSGGWRIDKTPSTHIMTQRSPQKFTDYGSPSHYGDVIDWVRFTRNMDTREAIKFLSSETYNPIPKAKEIISVEGNIPQNITMGIVNQYASRLSLAMPYFEKRGISREIAKIAKLGYESAHPIYQKIDGEWLGSPLMTVPIFIIPNYIGYDGHRQELRAIHYRYDTDVARQKIRDMFYMGSPNINKLARWLSADNPEEDVFKWLFGNRYSNLKGSQSRLFNSNRLLTLDVDKWQPAPLQYVIITEGPLPAYVLESAGFYSVGLPHSEKNIDPAVAFKNIIRIFVATDDDEAGKKRYEWIKRTCGENRVIRVPMQGQADDMVLNKTLHAYMERWNVRPNSLLTTATPWI